MKAAPPGVWVGKDEVLWQNALGFIHYTQGSSEIMLPVSAFSVLAGEKEQQLPHCVHSPANAEDAKPRRKTLSGTFHTACSSQH